MPVSFSTSQIPSFISATTIRKRNGLYQKKRRNDFGFTINKYKVCTGKKITKESNLVLTVYLFPIYYLLLIAAW